MFTKKYSNFVRPATINESSSTTKTVTTSSLSGNEVRKIYLNEVKDIKVPDPHVFDEIQEKPNKRTNHHDRNVKSEPISDKDLYLSVQSDDVDTLKHALDSCPDNVDKLDDFGWSLLMIACQANSIECVKELLKRGADTTVSDKAGNSAQRLIIKNKNYQLADILLSNKCNSQETKTKNKGKQKLTNVTDDYFCVLCNIKVSNKNKHLSSTIHNINLSKEKKLPTNYVIPETNKGFQIMLKVGWDKESGLGPDGSGKKYPIKTVQKQDKKGLGHGKRQTDSNLEPVKNKIKKVVDHEHHRKLEIKFRREFY